MEVPSCKASEWIVSCNPALAHKLLFASHVQPEQNHTYIVYGIYTVAYICFDVTSIVQFFLLELCRHLISIKYKDIIPALCNNPLV